LAIRAAVATAHADVAYGPSGDSPTLHEPRHLPQEYASEAAAAWNAL